MCVARPRLAQCEKGQKTKQNLSEVSILSISLELIVTEKRTDTSTEWPSRRLMKNKKENGKKAK